MQFAQRALGLLQRQPVLPGIIAPVALSLDLGQGWRNRSPLLAAGQLPIIQTQLRSPVTPVDAQAPLVLPLSLQGWRVELERPLPGRQEQLLLCPRESQAEIRLAGQLQRGRGIRLQAQIQRPSLG